MGRQQQLYTWLQTCHLKLAKCLKHGQLVAWNHTVCVVTALSQDSHRGQRRTNFLGLTAIFYGWTHLLMPYIHSLMF